jgi:glycine cleavage system aminomethyltransferase T
MMQVSFKLLDGSASLWGGEPIYHNGERVGKLTSGGIGHTVNDGGALGKETRLRHFILKVIILPRQAQDKRRESTQKETRFCRQRLRRPRRCSGKGT